MSKTRSRNTFGLPRTQRERGSRVFARVRPRGRAGTPSPTRPDRRPMFYWRAPIFAEEKKEGKKERTNVRRVRTDERGEGDAPEQDFHERTLFGCTASAAEKRGVRDESRAREKWSDRHKRMLPARSASDDKCVHPRAAAVVARAHVRTDIVRASQTSRASAARQT